MAASNLDLPFYVGSAVVVLLLVLTLAVGGSAVRAMRPAAPVALPEPRTA
jgi:hypothetical protein